MIKYALVCDKDHAFESWFANSDSFDKQVKRGLVDCPHCGSSRVAKALMAPSVATSRKKEARSEALREAVAKAPAPTAAPVPAAPVLPPALLDDKHTELRAAVRDLHEKVIANSEDVGAKFPEQARKMADGDLPTRAIRGEATFEEARELWEDGIPVMPIPPLPDDRN